MSNHINSREEYTPKEYIHYQIQAIIRAKSRYENGAIRLTERADIEFNKVISSIGLDSSNKLKELYAHIYVNTVQVLTISSDLSALRIKILSYRKYQPERKELDNLIKMKETELEKYQRDISEAHKDAEVILSQINKIISELKITSLLESVVKDEYIAHEYENEVIKLDSHIETLKNSII